MSFKTIKIKNPSPKLIEFLKRYREKHFNNKK